MIITLCQVGCDQRFCLTSKTFRNTDTFPVIEVARQHGWVFSPDNKAICPDCANKVAQSLLLRLQEADAAAPEQHPYPVAENHPEPAAEPEIPLLPCPFCGGRATIREEPASPPEIEAGYWTVSCSSQNDCSCWPSAMGDTRPEAIQHWNRRWH